MVKLLWSNKNSFVSFILYQLILGVDRSDFHVFWCYPVLCDIQQAVIEEDSVFSEKKIL